MPKYRYTDPGTGKSYISGEKLTPDELDEAFGANTPPLSAASGIQGQPEQAATKLGKVGAITSRVGLPLIGGAIGALTPIPGGAAIGGAIGAGLGTVAGNEIEGKPSSALEVGTQAALGLVAPGAGSTVLKGALKAGAYGLGSVTLDSLSRGEGLPEPGHAALGAIIGAATGGVITKLHLRSALKEVLPSDVADEAHAILTTGKPATETPSIALKEEAAEVKRVLRDARGRFIKPTPVTEKLQKPTIRVRLAETPSQYEYGGVGGMRPVPPERLGVNPIKSYEQLEKEGKFNEFDYTTTEKKFRWKRVGKGEYIKEPIGEDALPTNQPPADEPSVRGRVKAGTAFFQKLTPPIWLYDRLQRQTGLPVYDDVYRPIREAVESGSDEALDNVIKSVKSKYPLGNDSPIDPIVKRTIQGTIAAAQGRRDDLAKNIDYGMQVFNKKVLRRQIDDETARRWTNNLVTLQYQGPLPGRVGPALRNMSQTLQTGYAFLGERWFPHGLRRAFTTKGYNEAVASGVLGPEHSITAELEKPTSIPGKISGVFWAAYRKIDDYNNAIMYLGQHGRTLSAARRAGGNVQKFVDLANLDIGIPQSEAVQIAKLYAGGQVQEAAKRAGVARANATQFLYGGIDRPQGMQSTAGKVMLGYGTWPIYYGNMLKESAVGPGSAIKKGMTFARWVGANALLASVATDIYRQAGNKNPEARARDFTMFGPLFYGGGAAYESVKGVEEAGRKAYEDRKFSGKAFYKAVKPLVPYSYAVEDVIWAGQSLKKTMEDR